MKKLPKIFYCNVTLVLLFLLLVACTGGTNEASKTDTTENKSTSQSEKKFDDTEESSQVDKEEEVTDSTPETEEVVTESKEENPLSKYSSKEIEYARIWLQLGSNQEIADLYVRHISTGTPLNSEDDTSANYLEDVIQLSGTRLVDGSVTYSGNGDGTINLYNVPLRWDGKYPAGEKFYNDIIENTNLVNVDIGNDAKIIELINKMNIE
ncbi:hypothetical protein [Sutcliffiella halmapala]|uniref:hypothetical protein n=1 Tax=Sutcliffiella halmapala TaxID=79882 RepID=UPI000995591A|nr:hypothetical protein [Sutcliffiella halmapala]